jgi:hypothetical protein
MRIATVRDRCSINQRFGATGPACGWPYGAVPKPRTTEVPASIAKSLAIGNDYAVEVHRGRRGIGKSGTHPGARLRRNSDTLERYIKEKDAVGVMRSDQRGVDKCGTTAKRLDAIDPPVAVLESLAADAARRSIGGPNAV